MGRLQSCAELQDGLPRGKVEKVTKGASLKLSSPVAVRNCLLFGLKEGEPAIPAAQLGESLLPSSTRVVHRIKGCRAASEWVFARHSSCQHMELPSQGSRAEPGTDACWQRNCSCSSGQEIQQQAGQEQAIFRCHWRAARPTEVRAEREVKEGNMAQGKGGWEEKSGYIKLTVQLGSRAACHEEEQHF